MLNPDPPALVLAVHGSAAPAAAATVGRLTRNVEGLRDVRPVVGHLDHQGPSLATALGRVAGSGHTRAVVVPLLLGDGFHRTVDIPAVVEAAGSGIDCVLTEGLSGEQDVALALYGRLREAECRAGARADAVVLAAAGSSRPGGKDGAKAAVRQLRTLLHAERGSVPVRPAYCSAAEPTVPLAIAQLRAAGHRRIAVATHLLAPGRFTDALAQSGAWAVSGPIADHPRIARVVVARYDSALNSLALTRCYERSSAS
ncbi:sirohydrochlorin chelatase [Streptomyces beijiangensis]|uniref:Sirohydrochlorin chelatase n=1 Tax=Streptomyces beijiangensis TaxID=163361 RepID=A0A939JGF6_9ACTN|nr:sirohydrochlorin chelatase [Streptomyces beijiangensis]MBO0511502.1 sirohydrochlorin chelatase [Streptomyces beijiangensis]